MNKQYVGMSCWNTMRSFIDDKDYHHFQVEPYKYPGNPFVLTVRRSQGTAGFMIYRDSILEEMKFKSEKEFLKEYNLEEHIARNCAFYLAEQSTVAFQILSPPRFTLTVKNRMAMLKDKGIMKVTPTASQNEVEFIRLCQDCLENSEIKLCSIREIEENDESLFGKICYGCHTPLADWFQCAFCHEVWWQKAERHMCDNLADKLKIDPYYLSLDSGIITNWKKNPVED